MKSALTIEEAKEILIRNNWEINEEDSDDVLIGCAKIARFFEGRKAAKEERKLQKAADHLEKLNKYYSIDAVEARHAEIQAHDENTPSALNFIRNSSEAKDYRDMAIWVANHAVKSRKCVAERLETKLLRLQTLRLEIWKQELADFIMIFGRIKNVERSEDLPDYKNIKIPDAAVLASMEECSGPSTPLHSS